MIILICIYIYKYNYIYIYVCVCVSNVIRSSWLSPIKSHEIHRKAPYSPYLLCLSAPSRTIPQDSPFRNHRNLVTSQVLHTPQSPSKQSTAPPASQAAPPSEPAMPAILGMVLTTYLWWFGGLIMVVKNPHWMVFLATSGCTENIE